MGQKMMSKKNVHILPSLPIAGLNSSSPCFVPITLPKADELFNWSKISIYHFEMVAKPIQTSQPALLLTEHIKLTFLN